MSSTTKSPEERQTKRSDIQNETKSVGPPRTPQCREEEAQVLKLQGERGSGGEQRRQQKGGLRPQGLCTKNRQKNFLP